MIIAGNIIETIKVFFIGVIEGITEWLPISSTGHMILFEDLFPLNASEDFIEMFNVVIQFGAILAVIVLYFSRLNPFSRKKSSVQKKNTWKLWSKIIIACLPAAFIGLFLDDWMNEHLYNHIVVAIALIVYGIAFIIIERKKANSDYKINQAEDIDYKTALFIGCFQVLSLIPGTSRSGSTIIGSLLLGVSRPAAAEFSFFLAIPVMLGASILKIIKFFLSGNVLSSPDLFYLILGTIVSFLVSLIVVKSLVNFVRKHSFEFFGWYRIALGIIVLAFYFVISRTGITE